jgi:hypothetical protein
LNLFLIHDIYISDSLTQLIIFCSVLFCSALFCVVLFRIHGLPEKLDPKHFYWGLHQSNSLASKNLVDNITVDAVTPVNAKSNLYISRFHYDDGKGHRYRHHDLFKQLGLNHVTLEAIIVGGDEAEGVGVDAEDEVAEGSTTEGEGMIRPSFTVECRLHKVQVRTLELLQNVLCSHLIFSSRIH